MSNSENIKSSNFFSNIINVFKKLFTKKSNINKEIKEEVKEEKNKLINYQTINKSERNVEQDFKQNEINKEFNKEFEAAEIELPHQRGIITIIKNSFILLYSILEMIANNENPIPYIFSSADTHFHFTTLLFIFGVILVIINKFNLFLH